MRDQDPVELNPLIAPFCELPPIAGDRRREQDRRSAERQGKFDRRRNRCMHCLHFQEPSEGDKGLCLLHQAAVASDAFACPNFDPHLSGEARKPIRS
ncbi:hypothetical protein [Vampirovibrio chlorellavorus]|uniref:hypothetical protein n=1 Tax=Vampirovibrio chlorellavorus TaxID=758823 RepID=UPI0026EC4035|nr:hypothetical protein [Vampirovibrio chlorellavorus]